MALIGSPNTLESTVLEDIAMSGNHFGRFVLAAMLCAALVAAFNPCVSAQEPTVTYTDLHDFNDSAGDPENFTNSGVMPQGRDGNIYGTSQQGGSGGVGAIYQISTGGSLSVVANVTSSTGTGPECGLTRGSDGNFYGIAPQGGSSNAGTVFKVTPSGTLTVLHQFTNGTDGSGPSCPPVEASNGDYYGTTNGIFEGNQGTSTFYKVTSTGTFTLVHTFALSEGNRCSAVTLGTDGNFYGACLFGGANNLGTLYKITPEGVVTVLHSLVASDGQNEQGAFLVQAEDGNFYGMGFNGGADNYGVIFQLKTNGTYTVLHTFTGGTDGGNPNADLVVGSDGYLYGAASVGGSTTNCSAGCGTLFKISTSGTFTVLYSFDGTHGSNPQSNLTLDTNGVLYGVTESGGANGDGVFFSLNVSFNPFVTLQGTAGSVGSKVGILGQGFSSSSVVKFNGTQATTVTPTGTTYLTATVPAGATDGYVTVTTGSTTLTSTQKYTVHNSWASGSAIPVAVAGAAAGVISGKIYVVSGEEATGAPAVNNNQVYNPTTNTWTTAAVIPTPVVAPASAVVGGLLYVIGGYEESSGTPSNLVQIYNPKTNAWTTGAAMPTARGSVAAAVDGTSIYVIGGNGATDRLTNVEKYVPSTNTWTEEDPLLTGVSEASAGLLGSTIVAADGYTTSGDLGTTEGYDVSTNAWSSLTSDPNPRNGSCYGVISGLLYVASGLFANPSETQPLTVNESFSATGDKWTSLDATPNATFFPGSVVDNGQLYCFGGFASYQGAVINNVQIYQP
jgi:uncharacterized repeat protein (TIGR03803 family)